MDFARIVQRMHEGNLGENEIADYRNHCAVWLFRLNESYGKLLARSAVWQVENGENYKSQAACERAFEATEEGQRMLREKYQIRGIEAISDALQGSYWLKQREWKEANKI